MALRTAKKSVREASISENGPGCKAVVHQRHGEFYEGQGTPQPLSGLGGSRRVAWAVGLQQPENAPSRQSSRIGFPHFEDFLANLERDMSLVETELSAHNRGKLEARLTEDQKPFEQLRSRLLSLAAELERGTIVHHRTVRVSKLNQLREQAIKNLRSQASEQVPQTLPGPEASQWIQWACGLQDSEDAEVLQTLRNGFAHLDDFAARLDPNMWKPAESPASETPTKA